MPALGAPMPVYSQRAAPLPSWAAFAPTIPLSIENAVSLDSACHAFGRFLQRGLPLPTPPTTGAPSARRIPLAAMTSVQADSVRPIGCQAAPIRPLSRPFFENKACRTAPLTGFRWPYSTWKPLSALEYGQTNADTANLQVLGGTRPRGQVPRPRRLRQNQEPRVVADQVQPPELHRTVPAQPAVPRRALEGPRLPARQRPHHTATCRSPRPANCRNPSRPRDSGAPPSARPIDAACPLAPDAPPPPATTLPPCRTRSPSPFL